MCVYDIVSSTSHWLRSSAWVAFPHGRSSSAHGSVSTRATVPAHAKVYKAIPAIGSTIAQAPTTVTVFTLENINPDPRKSNLFVYGPGGDLISQGNAKVALNDPRQMSITIKAAGNGIYVVRWITVSAVDGAPDEGAFVFTVKPTAPAGTVTPTKTTTTPSASGIALWVPIVVGVLALLLGLLSGRSRSAQHCVLCAYDTQNGSRTTTGGRPLNEKHIIEEHNALKH